jgi:uncharacterized membrane protein YkvA (DUF1232 family)
MTENTTPGGSRLAELLRMGQHAWRLFGDSRVPLSVKAIPMLAALYVVSPLDLLPDVIPIMGQVDDIAILLVALRLFTQLAAKYEVASPPPPGARAEREVTTTYRVRED